MGIRAPVKKNYPVSSKFPQIRCFEAVVVGGGGNKGRLGERWEWNDSKKRSFPLKEAKRWIFFSSKKNPKKGFSQKKARRGVPPQKKFHENSRFKAILWSYFKSTLAKRHHLIRKLFLNTVFPSFTSKRLFWANIPQIFQLKTPRPGKLPPFSFLFSFSTSPMNWKKSFPCPAHAMRSANAGEKGGGGGISKKSSSKKSELQHLKKKKRACLQRLLAERPKKQWKSLTYCQNPSQFDAYPNLHLSMLCKATAKFTHCKTIPERNMKGEESESEITTIKTKKNWVFSPISVPSSKLPTIFGFALLQSSRLKPCPPFASDFFSPISSLGSPNFGWKVT